MIADKLRKSILQSAIQGKLTDQLPEDGDARELLTQIQVEKERLIKEGKIKREKPLPAIAEDEIPFDIPENWCWVRLNEILNFIDYRGMTPEKIQSGVRLITANNIKLGAMDLTSESYISKENYLSRKSRGITKKGDILFTTEAPLGHCCINEFELCSCGQRIITLQEYGETAINKQYFMFVLLSSFFQKLVSDNRSGVTAKGIKAAKLKQLIVPVPPLLEQERIVAKVEEAFNLIKSLEKDEQKLNLLQKSFPKKMKDSLLQAAIQGKLTEQLESDGDARALVADIQKEKEQHIRAGKIKQEKALPEITEDEISFDIPDNWCWVRLGVLIRLISGTSYSQNDLQTTGIRIIRGGNINDETSALKLCDDDVFVNNVLSDKDKSLKKGDIVIVASTGSKKVIGKPAFVNKDLDDIQIGAFLRIVRPIHLSFVDYIRCIFKSSYYRENIRKVTQGTNINNIKADHILNLIIPLPPLAEQHRIVKRLEQLLPLCDALE